MLCKWSFSVIKEIIIIIINKKVHTTTGIEVIIPIYLIFFFNNINKDTYIQIRNNIQKHTLSVDKSHSMTADTNTKKILHIKRQKC